MLVKPRSFVTNPRGSLPAPIVDVLGPECVAAIEIVRQAARLMLEFQQGRTLDVTSKADTSPLTVADLAVQALLTAGLNERWPGEAIVAEEDAAVLRTADHLRLRNRVLKLVRRWHPDLTDEQLVTLIDRGDGSGGGSFWTVDPIDGTRGLLLGGQYAIALAHVVDGVVENAVLACPRLSLPSLSDDAEGGIAVAARGRGAWWTKLDGGSLNRLRVSGVAATSRARTVHSRESKHANTERFEQIVGRLGIQAAPIGVDSQVKHVLIAAGAVDLMLRVPADPAYREAIWDQAAGSLLIEEAGGRVTDLRGQPLDFTTGRRLERNSGVIASNGLLHDAAIGGCAE